jgi:DNA-binding transcriptional LysR family regulator
MRTPNKSLLFGRLRLRQLALLVALDEHRNLHRAAAATHMTQPSATNVLRDIELLLGFPLFKRMPRGMEPTRMGAEVLVFARRMLSEMTRFVQDLECKRNGGNGELVAGVVVGGSAGFVAQALVEMKQRRPLLAVKLKESTSEDAIKLLLNRDTDLAVGRFTEISRHKDISYEPMGNEPVCVVARKGHPASRASQLHLRELQQCAWILQPLPLPVRQMIEEEFEDASMTTPANIIECTSVFETIELVERTDSVTVLPVSFVRDRLNGGVLARIPILVGKNLMGFGVITRRETSGTAAAEFVDLLRRHSATASCSPLVSLSQSKRQNGRTKNMGVRPQGTNDGRSQQEEPDVPKSESLHSVASQP